MILKEDMEFFAVYLVQTGVTSVAMLNAASNSEQELGLLMDTVAEKCFLNVFEKSNFTKLLLRKKRT